MERNILEYFELSRNFFLFVFFFIWNFIVFFGTELFGLFALESSLELYLQAAGVRRSGNPFNFRLLSQKKLTPLLKKKILSEDKLLVFFTFWPGPLMVYQFSVFSGSRSNWTVGVAQKTFRPRHVILLLAICYFIFHLAPRGRTQHSAAAELSPQKLVTALPVLPAKDAKLASNSLFY
jgi:hypothetical protein